MTMLSFRVTADEKKKLKQWVQQQGYGSISELIRSQFGFTPKMDGVSQADMPENFDGLVNYVGKICERMDELKVMTNSIAKTVGAKDAVKSMHERQELMRGVKVPETFDR